jgi:hypothetical protein
MNQIQFITTKEDLQSILSIVICKVLGDLNSQPNDNDFSQFDLINSRELSQKLGISIPTLFRWRKKGKIPYLRVGKSIKYNLGDVIKAIEVRRGL